MKVYNGKCMFFGKSTLCNFYIICIVISVVGFTLAFVYYRSEATAVTLLSESDLGRFINYKTDNLVLGGEDAGLVPGDDYTSGLFTEIEFWKVAVAHNMGIYGHLYLDIDQASAAALNMESLKWAVVSNDILISEGNFIGYTEGSTLPILVNHKLLPEETTFKVYLWIDENEYMDSQVEGEVISMTVWCEATVLEYERFGSYEFDYTGSIETISLTAGTYMLEVWGCSRWLWYE